MYYGIYQSEKKGMAHVDDAVLPAYHEVPVKDLIDIPMGYPTNEFSKVVDAAYQQARKTSKATQGLAPGKLFHTSVADGSAYYVVLKVTKSKVTIAWRGFCPDRWFDQVLGAGGSFPRATIARLVTAQEDLARIFGIPD